MQILKKWWFWVIIVIILVGFFFPKPSGGGGRPGVQPLPQTWNDKECACFGFETNINKQSADVGYFNVCFGIPFSCNCFENKIEKEGVPIERKEIACE